MITNFLHSWVFCPWNPRKSRYQHCPFSSPSGQNHRRKSYINHIENGQNEAEGKKVKVIKKSLYQTSCWGRGEKKARQWKSQLGPRSWGGDGVFPGWKTLIFLSSFTSISQSVWKTHKSLRDASKRANLHTHTLAHDSEVHTVLLWPLWGVEIINIYWEPTKNQVQSLKAHNSPMKPVCLPSSTEDSFDSERLSELLKVIKLASSGAEANPELSWVCCWKPGTRDWWWMRDGTSAVARGSSSGTGRRRPSVLYLWICAPLWNCGCSWQFLSIKALGFLCSCVVVNCSPWALSFVLPHVHCW